jgi:hypothetical protein
MAGTQSASARRTATLIAARFRPACARMFTQSNIRVCWLKRCLPNTPARAISRPRTVCAVRPNRAHNSVVECVLHTDEVAGSNPAAPTKIPFASYACVSLESQFCYNREEKCDAPSSRHLSSS